LQATPALSSKILSRKGKEEGAENQVSFRVSRAITIFWTSLVPS